MRKKKLQVFVSSTFTDMLVERQAAVEVILRAGHIPAGMELFAAGDESQLDTIRRWIIDSDVFVLILGGRYGSIEPKSGKSYIELEYDFAVKNKKPLSAVIIKETYLDRKAKEYGLDVVERTNGVLLDSFRERVTKRICRFFNDINELKLIVYESLAHHSDNAEMIGWVRGDEVIDPKATLEEVNRLQGDNSLLREQIENLTAELSIARQVKSTTTVAAIGADALRVLEGACRDSGLIAFVESNGASTLRVGRNDIIRIQSSRDAARWKSAVDHLLSQELVEPFNDNDTHSYRVTLRGYEYVDRPAKKNADADLLVALYGPSVP